MSIPQAQIVELMKVSVVEGGGVRFSSILRIR